MKLLDDHPIMRASLAAVAVLFLFVVAVSIFSPPGPEPRPPLTQEQEEQQRQRAMRWQETKRQASVAEAERLRHEPERCAALKPNDRAKDQACLELACPGYDAATYTAGAATDRLIGAPVCFFEVGMGGTGPSHKSTSITARGRIEVLTYGDPLGGNVIITALEGRILTATVND